MISQIVSRFFVVDSGIKCAVMSDDAFRAALAIREEFNAVRQVKTEQVTVQGEKWLAFTLSLNSRY